jgi:hypothetical protein
MKQIQLPKEHISYSQIQLWKNNKERYKKIYFENKIEYRLNNPGLKYGKVVANALEREEDTGDLLTDSAMVLLKKYDERDQEIKTKVETRDKEFFYIVGRPDTLNSITKEFREYKTGKTKWTQTKAQNDKQVLFYAMLIFLEYKVVLKEAYLDWIETYENELGEIIPTGKVESFRIVFSLTKILECLEETIKVAKEIETAYMTHIPSQETPPF